MTVTEMLAQPHPIGTRVWIAVRTTVRVRPKCPACLGKRELRVIRADMVEAHVACHYCPGADFTTKTVPVAGVIRESFVATSTISRHITYDVRDKDGKTHRDIPSTRLFLTLEELTNNIKQASTQQV